jgi:hypothetical protein
VLARRGSMLRRWADFSLASFAIIAEDSGSRFPPATSAVCSLIDAKVPINFRSHAGDCQNLLRICGIPADLRLFRLRSVHRHILEAIRPEIENPCKNAEIDHILLKP